MRGGMDRLWQLTQYPALHQWWDLRFSTIPYLPKKDENASQKFVSETRIATEAIRRLHHLQQIARPDRGLFGHTPASGGRHRYLCRRQWRHRDSLWRATIL